MKKILLVIFIVVFFSGAIFYLLNNQTKINNKTNLPGEETSSAIDTEADPATTMENYRDENLGFAIEYPANWDFEKQGDYSIRMMQKLKKPAASETNFIQIQIVPKKINVPDSSIYGFNGENFRKLINSTSQEIAISEDSTLQEYFTYEKQPSIKLADLAANVYINKKPWEFPSGTTEYKYIFNTVNKYVVLSAFLGTDTKDQFYISRDSFQRVLNTLKISDKDNLGEVGTITGKLCFPSERLPGGVIQALNVVTKNMYEYIYPGSSKGGKSTYELKVIPGEYILRYKTNEMEGYHTDVCPTGMETSCNAANQRKHVFVNVKSAETIKDVDLCDFYYNTNTKPEF